MVRFISRFIITTISLYVLGLALMVNTATASLIPCSEVTGPQANVSLYPNGKCVYSDGTITPPSKCDAGGGVTNDYCPTTPAPEMSDYLAMAFVMAAGAMIYYFRRQALAKA